MTEFNRIKGELCSLGYETRQGKGDHVIFTKEGRQDIIIAMSVSSGNRGWQNCLADIRRKEPEFRMGRPAAKKTEPETEERPALPESSFQETTARPASPADRNFIRSHAWIRTGTEVTMRDGDDSVFTVTSIDSDDGKTIRSEDDILHLRGKDGRSTEVFPEEVDAAKVRKCIRCGCYRPLNWYGSWYKSEEKQNTCRECLSEASCQADINGQKETERMKTGMNTAAAGGTVMPEEKQLLEEMAEIIKLIPTPMLVCEIAERNLPTSLLKPILDKVEAQMPRQQTGTAEDLTSQELFDILKERGFRIVDGKFKRIVEEVLE